MENDYLNMLARIVLPAQILDYFLISGVEQISKEIYISLDEKMNPELSKDLHFESKGFMAAVSVTDFTRYSKEFGAFLKETYGDVPGDLPYA